LALVQDDDLIELDVESRRLELLVPEGELAARRKAWVAPNPPQGGGYQSLYVERVLQADQGCDFDFLVGRRDAGIPRHSH
jgi:dihydroxyacid dehydratase/phosphogluconate dehydratase